MRTFCTEGPVDPERNYFVTRKELLEQGLSKVDEWRYFTLFAPWQSGKSTYFQMLCTKIESEKPEWLPVWIPFEHYHKPELDDFLRYFQRQLALECKTEVKLSGKLLELPDFFEKLFYAAFCRNR